MDKKAFQTIKKKLGLTNEGVSKALDVELFTVRQWASGLWEIPRPIVKFLHTLLSIKRDKKSIAEDYKELYLAGYRAGYKRGLSNEKISGNRSE